MALLVLSKKPVLVKCLGGTDYLTDIEKRATALQLPDCPSCGSQACVHIFTVEQAAKFKICCTSCRATTDIEPSRPCMTANEALTTVAAHWHCHRIHT